MRGTDPTTLAKHAVCVGTTTAGKQYVNIRGCVLCHLQLISNGGGRVEFTGTHAWVAKRPKVAIVVVRPNRPEIVVELDLTVIHFVLAKDAATTCET